MADITLKLIWYRLSLTYSKMATAASTWYTDLDFDSYVLDLLLLAWCAGAAIVVVTVNSLKSALGPVTKQPGVERTRDYALAGDGVFASAAARDQHGIETCHWFNTTLSWLYLHYYHSPVYLEEWVKSLNDQLTKLGVHLLSDSECCVRLAHVPTSSVLFISRAILSSCVCGFNVLCRLMGARTAGLLFACLANCLGNT